MSHGPVMCLRDWRRRAKLTQKQLEGLSSVDETTISNVETRRYTLSPAQTVQIARALGIEPNQILKEEPRYLLKEQVEPMRPREQPLQKPSLLEIRLEALYMRIEQLAGGLRHFTEGSEKIEAAEELAQLSSELVKKLKGTK